MTAEQERERIVAWLRADLGGFVRSGDRTIANAIANAIERGDHLEAQTNGGEDV